MKGSMMRKKMIIMVAVAGLLFALAASANAELVTHYKLDEATGSIVAVDATGNGNDGAMAGTTVSVTGSPDPTSSSAMSTGGGVLSGVAPVDVDNAFTIMFWLNADSYSSGFNRIFTIGADTDTTSEVSFAQEFEEGVSNIEAVWYNLKPVETESEITVFKFEETFLVTAAWQHHAAVVNGTTVTWYVDGVERATNDTMGGNVDSTLFYILGSPTQPGTNFPASIDEVKVFDTALSLEEIVDNMAGSACDAKTLDGYDVAAALEIGDWNHDCKVNLVDFADMASTWLNEADLAELDAMALNWLTDVTDESL
jgi:hypothetical protein